MLRGVELVQFLWIHEFFVMSASYNESVMPSQGINGLAMLTPIIGFPIFFHALSGMVVAGIGVTAYNNVVAPLAGKLVEFTQDTLPQLLPPLTPSILSIIPAQEVPVVIPITIKAKETSLLEA
uniref:Uncharacterized protein n=1 Tax=Chlorobium chlorochromatii (strain CaD3) TaxID=340177 RepID=Q3AQD4_CHLCH